MSDFAEMLAGMAPVLDARRWRFVLVDGASHHSAMAMAVPLMLPVNRLSPTRQPDCTTRSRPSMSTSWLPASPVTSTGTCSPSRSTTQLMP